MRVLFQNVPGPPAEITDLVLEQAGFNIEGEPGESSYILSASTETFVAWFVSPAFDPRMWFSIVTLGEGDALDHLSPKSD